MSKSRLASPLFLLLPFLASYSFMARAQGPLEILWLDAEHTRPYVIPQEAFSRLDWSNPEKTDLSSLPLAGEQQATLRTRVAKKLKTAATSKAAGQGCSAFPIGEDFGFANRPPGTQTLADLVDAVGLSLTGRVTRLLPVWNPVAGRPYTRVFLQADDLLKIPPSGLDLNQELSYLLPYGEISFGQIRECLTLPQGTYTPKVGDRVLFLGWRDPVNLQNLYVQSFFEIRDGKVVPGAHASLRDHSPVSLDNLKNDIRRQPAEKD
jgi:hypothetical protein